MSELGVSSKCALCLSKETKEDSHIIPAFIYRWMKKTSGTGHLRKASNINRRLQDGPKYPLLCECCEDLFSGYEKYFADYIFHPYTKAETKPQSVDYDPKFLKFLVSVIWRATFHCLDDTENNSRPLHSELEGKMDQPQQVWRDFLLSERNNISNFQVFVVPFDKIGDANLGGKPHGLNSYNCRSVDLDLIASSSWGFTYVKIPYFMILGKIFGKGHSNFSNNLKIQIKGGRLGGKNMKIPQYLLDYILDRTQWISEQREKLSEKQNEVITKSIEKSPNYENSETLKMTRLDQKLNQKWDLD